MQRTCAFLFFVLGVLAAATAAPNDAFAAADALMDYVAKPDDSYTWRVHARYREGDSEVIELRLHSQTWREVLWKHQLYIIKPSRIATEHQGLLIVGGGRWRDSYETAEPSNSLPEDADLFLKIAEQLQTVVAVVGQVPFQPLFGMTEDRIIAYTFDQYLSTGDSEWPLLLPMVKSAIRAMDATQEASSAEWELQLKTFTLLGGSKRGWTTWLAAAVDERVTALAPVVIDVLNMAQHFPYQTEVWGSPSVKIRPYTELNLHQVLGSSEGHALREIVDPFAYRSMIRQPKLIVIATNDEYFPVDSLNLYWDDLAGPKYVLYLPNDRHSIEDYGRVIPSLNALHRNAAEGTPMPQLAWEYESGDAALTLCLRSDVRPYEVRSWTANSDDRDFRDAQWSSTLLEFKGDIYVFELPRPSNGYSAVYGEAVFGEGRSAYSLSTNLTVLGSRGADSVGRSAPSSDGVCELGQ